MNIYRGGRSAALTGLTVLVLVACGQGTPPTAVTSVTVSPTSLSLAVGASGTLTATVTTAGTAVKTVTWASADSDVATVNPSGVVTAVAEGTTTVTATSAHDTSKKASAQVTVSLTGEPNTDAPLEFTEMFGSDVWNSGDAIAVDAQGFLYVIGGTQGDFPGPHAGGANDAFVSKRTADGTEVWTRQFGTAGSDVATAVAVDGNGDVLVAGDTTGDLGGPNAGKSDGFLRKYTADGEVAWTVQFGSDENEYVLALAVGANGNIYLGGMWDTGTAPESGTGFIRTYRYASDGLSVEEVGTIQPRYAVRGLAADADGNVIAVGALRFDDRGAEVWVLKLDSDRSTVWSKAYGSGAEPDEPSGDRAPVPATRTPLARWQGLGGFNDAAHAVAVDADGNIYVTGHMGARNVGLATTIWDYREPETFVLKLAPDGTELWAVLFETGAGTIGRAIAVDDAGNVALASNIQTFISWPNYPGTEMLVRLLTPDGELVWEEIYGGTGRDRVEGVVGDQLGNVFFTGSMRVRPDPEGPNVQYAYLRKYGP